MSRTPVVISNRRLNLKPFVEQTIGGYCIALEATLKAAFRYALPRAILGSRHSTIITRLRCLAAQRTLHCFAGRAREGVSKSIFARYRPSAYLSAALKQREAR